MKRFAAILLCLVLIAEKMVTGILVGLAGMVILLMLIPLVKGLTN